MGRYVIFTNYNSSSKSASSTSRCTIIPQGTTLNFTSLVSRASIERGPYTPWCCNTDHLESGTVACFSFWNLQWMSIDFAISSYITLSITDTSVSAPAFAFPVHHWSNQNNRASLYLPVCGSGMHKFLLLISKMLMASAIFKTTFPCNCIGTASNIKGNHFRHAVALVLYQFKLYPFIICLHYLPIW